MTLTYTREDIWKSKSWIWSVVFHSLTWHFLGRYAAPTWCGIAECCCAFYSYPEYVFLGGGLHFVHYFCLSELISPLHPRKQGKTANSVGQTLKCQPPTLKSHYFLSSCTFLSCSFSLYYYSDMRAFPGSQQTNIKSTIQ